MTVDRIRALLVDGSNTCGQRVLLMSVAVVAIVVPSVGLSLGETGAPSWINVLVASLAVIAVVQPDSHVAIIAMAVLVLQWLASRDASSALSLVVALHLYAFHALVALMAVTSRTSAIALAVIRRWALRSLGVTLWTVATFLLSRLVGRLSIGGNVVLSSIAIGLLALAIFAIGEATSTQRRDPAGRKLSSATGVRTRDRR